MNDQYFDLWDTSPEPELDTSELLPLTPRTQHFFQNPHQYPQGLIQTPGGSVGYVPMYSHNSFYWNHAVSETAPPVTTVTPATSVEDDYYQNYTDQSIQPARNGDPYILERKV